MRIAKAPEYVHAFAESAAIGDLEAIYELAKFSDDNPEEAQRLIAEYEPGVLGKPICLDKVARKALVVLVSSANQAVKRELEVSGPEEA